MTYSIEDYDKDFKKLAIEKLEKEAKEYKGNRYGDAVHTHVANTLRMFCSQSEEFATVFYKTKRSFSDCVAETMKGCGQHISDLDVYRKAAKFYFPDSEVEFKMTVTVGKLPDDKYINKVKKETPKGSSKPKPEKAEPPKAAKSKKEAPINKEPQAFQITLF